MDEVYKELKQRGFKNQRDCFKQGVSFGYELRRLEYEKSSKESNKEKEKVNEVGGE